MKKEQTTIRLEPLLKMQLLELVTKEKHQNLNDCVVKILSNHVFKKHEESKTSTKLENIEDG
ncbi:MAG: hypothetical protein H7Z76_03860, partial [Methylotenera sp.]|nr:hypothetical protein [Flavobacterium sp.]